MYNSDLTLEQNQKIMTKGKTIEDLLKYAKDWYEIEEKEARKILKESGYSTFKKELYSKYSNDYALYSTPLLNNGQTYYIRYYNISNGLTSDKTEYILLIPNDNGTALWASGNAWNFAQWK